MFPIIIEGSYQLVVEFSRESGDNPCVVQFPVGKHSVGIVVGAFPSRGGIGGMGNIDGKDMNDNPATFRPSLLTNGHHFQMTITVHLVEEDATIEAFLDNRRIIRWQGKATSLSPMSDWSVPDPKKAAFGHVDTATLYAVRMRQL
jgi:hypothetical protein